ENSANVHKWMAIIMDTRNGLVSLENRVKYSPIVRDHLIRACELNPQDFTSQYMLGRWCFEMSQLSWIQRVIAKYFIATEPPKSSYEEAYRYLSKAEELQPRTFLPNIYLLGKTCIEMGQFYKAKYYLNLAVNLRPRDECERCCINKAKYLMSKLDRYDLGKNVLFYDTYPFGFSD
ncbi:hypothetical protein NQ314_007834, partial [Rhamnusium bicolor]